MNVLVIGSGGREHALCWAIAASPLVKKVFCAPGNGGIAEQASCLQIEPDNITGILEACEQNSIDLVVVGPEDPLVAGIADMLVENKIRVFGPNSRAAILEGSKGFTKDLCKKYDIPTAAYERFDNTAEAIAFVRQAAIPVVIKADGLAAGKGVVVAETLKEAETAIEEILAGKFGTAGSSLVVEEFLQGEELSFFALCDGKRILPLASAQDHKRVGDGDTGPNTGGMGAYSPAHQMDSKLEKQILEEIIEPTISAMQAEGRTYTGVLYAGLMLTDMGPKLIEYNVRFGDPECQVLLARLNCDIVPALIACCDGKLSRVSLSWKKEAAMTVVMASNGYPGAYQTGSIIGNLETATAAGELVFHAATRKDKGETVANGGRVLGVTALGPDLAAAREAAYRAVSAIDWPGGFYRRDIGWRALKNE